MPVDPLTLVEATQFREDHPDFSPGDTVGVEVRVVEGDKERTSTPTVSPGEKSG